MVKLKIASFNIKNTGMKKEKEINSKVLIDFIKNRKIDILGTQELTKEYEKNINDKLFGYKFYGNYRLGNGIFSKNKYNECNMIITNQKVSRHKTVHLPFVPKNIKVFFECLKKMSFSPRIATVIYFYIESIGKVRMINTHLEPRISLIRKKQLEKIKKIISKEDCPTILTGDFNMQLNNNDFKQFIVELKKYNLSRVEINHATWNGNNGKLKVLDHIFIPGNWIVLDKGVIDNISISDHYPIYVEVEIE